MMDKGNRYQWRKVTAIMCIGLTLPVLMTGCQPSTPDEVNAVEESAQANVGDVNDKATIAFNTASNPNISESRAQTIEALAGVPMTTLATFNPQEIKQGGATGVSITSKESYSRPSANIGPSRKGNFFIGNAFFKQPWVVAPSSTDSRDGLGALFNVAACQSCHIKDGRGHAPTHKDDDADSLLIRLAMPATNDVERELLRTSQIEKVTHPLYGGQLQDRGIQGVPAEAKIEVEWTDVPVTFADGYTTVLRRPKFELTHAGYGDFGDDLMLSPRVALPMIGLGLLEFIPDDMIKRQADSNDTNHDGISGKYNWVLDPETGEQSLGRFGWKAGQTRLITQNMSAFNEDMGLTSHIRPDESCIRTQKQCVDATTGADDLGDGRIPVEVSDQVAKFVEFYTQNLAVPNRRNADDPQVLAGKARFYDMGCQNCHTPRYQLPEGHADDDRLEQHGQIIYPYTDLLLHDMGEDLADRTITGALPSRDTQVEFLANSYEWRTPALWGTGLAQTVDAQATFLHDGRARNLMEAVLWHGGEAEAQKKQVLQLDKKGRADLNAFLNSL